MTPEEFYIWIESQREEKSAAFRRILRLIREDEREACAKVCEGVLEKHHVHSNNICATLIRRRK